MFVTTTPYRSAMGNTTTRPVNEVVEATYTLEGAGFGVYRPFPTRTLDHLDPFLLLDELEPKVYEPGERRGAPDHPHRGFETVSYILAGETEHRDSTGHGGIIRAGGVQWMTAGDGIIHSEMPGPTMVREGGLSHGFQLWVNLPRELKRTPPRYQSLEPGGLTTVEGESWTARIIAGSVLGTEGPARTHTPINYVHLTLRPGSEVILDIPPDHNIGVYAFKSRGWIGKPGVPLSAAQLAVLGPGEGDLSVRGPDPSREEAEPMEVLVLSGRPLNEPVARYGPFVMNTREELIEAVEDYNAGRFGTIPPMELD